MCIYFRFKSATPSWEMRTREGSIVCTVSGGVRRRYTLKRRDIFVAIRVRAFDLSVVLVCVLFTFIQYYVRGFAANVELRHAFVFHIRRNINVISHTVAKQIVSMAARMFWYVSVVTCSSRMLSTLVVSTRICL